MAIEIMVVSPSGPFKTIEYPKFILRRDNWNDYGFQTLYQLYFYNGGDDSTLIGNVKILKKGQADADIHQLNDGQLEPLDENYCSLGQELDYYERLADLEVEHRNYLLMSLRDIAIQPEFATDDFRSEEGWGTSLFREMSEDEDYIQLARTLLTKNYNTLPRIDLDFTFQMPGWDSPVCFKFDSPELKNPDVFLREKYELPSRIFVLIGSNGSGKSTLLARLARVVHASRSDRQMVTLSLLGQLCPEGLGFSRVVTISYSAFDSFQVPGVSKDDRAQIAKDIEAGEGRYVFCGLRDIVGELNEELHGNELHSSDDSENSDRRDKTLLKSIEVLADEFARTLKKIGTLNRQVLFQDALQPLLQDSSFNNLKERSASALFGDNPRDNFLGWSTGHKIVLHVVANLVAYTEPRSIVLFDEPESHLHPPLLAALMHSIRYVLEKKDAFAIVATHSPVVLQETMSRHVQVIRRVGSKATSSSPTIQTFAENIGAITSEAFSLTTDVTDYHTILKKIVDIYDSIDEIEAIFDGSLSIQARAYVMSLFAMKCQG